MRRLTKPRFTRTWPGAHVAKVPESEQVFQITLPDNGFGGLVLKPWGERKRTVFQIMPEVQAMVSRIPGIRTFMVTPPAAARRRRKFPVEPRASSATAEPEQILKFAAAVAADVRDQRHVRLSADH